MSSGLEDLNSSKVCKKLGNSEWHVGKYDRSLGIGSTWIHALTLSWIATLFVSIVTACAYLP
jgi:hypothetical protein